ncbi:MAG: hypothetical protein ACLUAO_00640 [Streptococcus sp.]
MVILDRETGIGQLVFEEAQAARLGVVVHAEHFSVNQTDDNYILWNNYYSTNLPMRTRLISLSWRLIVRRKSYRQFRRYTNHDQRFTPFRWKSA